MVRASQKRARRRALDRHGQAVDLTNYEDTGEDNFGENWDPTADSPKTVTARVDRQTRPRPDRDFREVADIDTAAAIYVKDSVTGIRDGGGEGATEVDVDQDGDPEYRVLEADDQDNGLVRLNCERVD